MPAKAPTICKQPGCGAASSGRYCPVHRQSNVHLSAARDRERSRRDAGVRRLYDSVHWRRRTRDYVLARDPLCRIAVLCAGHASSEDVDHIVRAEIYIELHGGDPAYFFDEANLRGACHADHARKTALERRGLWFEKKALQDGGSAAG